MSKLKELRQQIEAEGIGVYLPVVKRLFTAIDEHECENDTALQNKAESLQTQVNDLEGQLAELKTKQA